MIVGIPSTARILETLKGRTWVLDTSPHRLRRSDPGRLGDYFFCRAKNLIRRVTRRVRHTDVPVLDLSLRAWGLWYLVDTPHVPLGPRSLPGRYVRVHKHIPDTHTYDPTSLRFSTGHEASVTKTVKTLKHSTQDTVEDGVSIFVLRALQFIARASTPDHLRLGPRSDRGQGLKRGNRDEYDVDLTPSRHFWNKLLQLR